MPFTATQHFKRRTYVKVCTLRWRRSASGAARVNYVPCRQDNLLNCVRAVYVLRGRNIGWFLKPTEGRSNVAHDKRRGGELEACYAEALASSTYDIGCKPEDLAEGDEPQHPVEFVLILYRFFPDTWLFYKLVRYQEQKLLRVDWERRETVFRMQDNTSHIREERMRPRPALNALGLEIFDGLTSRRPLA